MADFQNTEEINNSLTGLLQLVTSNGLTGSEQISQTDTLMVNNRYNLISNNRQLLSQSYVEHGIIQTLIDLPVDDAFSRGYEIQTKLLDAEQIEELKIYCEKERVNYAITQASKWARLFGGGAVIIASNQDPETPLTIDSFNEKSLIKFIPVDMWELYHDQTYIEHQVVTDENKLDIRSEFYNYYGKKIHHTRVLSVEGKEAPSLIKPRLRGWGMSEMERVVRSINQNLKRDTVLFDFIDEAKVGVFKLKGYNASLMTSSGTNNIAKTIQTANILKSYNNALTMDSEDDFEQKQVSFSGLAEILPQIRQALAADLRMPMSKLFGISSAGFSSGEDDIENYNSMIEGEVRGKVKYAVINVLEIVCMKLFGFVPSDMQISFPSLRILNSEQEESVKEKKFNRIMQAFQSGLIAPKQAKEAINKDMILPIKIDETDDVLPPQGNFTVE
jgi:phage-related protein (TIGR01555 family)